MKKHLVVYGRTAFCPDQARTQRFLAQHDIAYTQINIDQDPEAGRRVEEWVGHRSVPTVVVANADELVPFAQPSELKGRSARSVDRGTVITEPSDQALEAFLKNNGLFDK